MSDSEEVEFDEMSMMSGLEVMVSIGWICVNALGGK